MSEPPPRSRTPAGHALRLAPVAVIVALAVAAYASGLLHHLTLAELGARRLPLVAYVAAHPALSALIYFGVYVAGVVLSLPVALALSLAGGFLFGAVEGAALGAAASTLGGVGIFLICRTAAGDLIKRLAGPRLQGMQMGAQRDALTLILTLRLVPMMPFWLINVGAGVLGMPLRAFAIGTALGVIPSSIIYAALGSGLGDMFDAGGHPSLAMLREPKVLLPLAALMVLAVAPLVWRRLRPGSKDAA